MDAAPEQNRYLDLDAALGASMRSLENPTHFIYSAWATREGTSSMLPQVTTAWTTDIGYATQIYLKVSKSVVLNPVWLSTSIGI